MNQVGMTVGNLVDIGNKVKTTAWTMARHPIRELFDLLVHPAKMVSRCIAAVRYATRFLMSKKECSTSQAQLAHWYQVLCHINCHLPPL